MEGIFAEEVWLNYVSFQKGKLVLCVLFPTCFHDNSNKASKLK